MFVQFIQEWQSVIFLACLALLSAWETLSPFFRQAHRGIHALRNLFIAAINGALLALLIAGLNVLVANTAELHHVGIFRFLGLADVTLMVVSFLAIDIWTYWLHRLNHEIRFLWRFHRMHHSDPSVDVTTGTRFHVGEIVISSFARLVMIPILGIPLEAILLFDAVQLPIILLHHANISLPGNSDRWLSYFLVTPFMHKVHHSRMKTETDSNYSSVLSVWDRLFRSFIERKDCNGIVFGLEGYDADGRQSIRGMLLTPMVRDSV